MFEANNTKTNAILPGAEPEVEMEFFIHKPEVKMVPKKITCPRCEGDGKWHTTRTGVRLATRPAVEPLIDFDSRCPKCKGSKTVTIMITEEQAKNENEAKAKRKKADNAAKQARIAADKAEAEAIKAEAKV